jgi:hypothetical protein
MLDIPEGNAICPACNGTKLGTPYTEQEKKYWPAETHHVCINCGGQTMFGKPLGYTRINPSTLLGCLHEYSEQLISRCYRKYTCKHCAYSFGIDSGD